MIGAINLNITKYNQVNLERHYNYQSMSFSVQISEEEAEKKIESYIWIMIYIRLYEDEVLAAKIHIRPFQIWLNGQKIRMGGIANVATYPEYRKKWLYT